MRLLELDAKFFSNASPTGYHRQVEIEGSQGVLFQCPRCAIGLERGEEDGRRFIRGAHYIIVPFSNPRNAPLLESTFMPQMARWEMTGTSLENLTTRPSIQIIGGCAWHGYITNGDAHE